MQSLRLMQKPVLECSKEGEIMVLEKGVKVTHEGWIDVDEMNAIPDVTYKILTGLFVTKTGASNIANVERDLKQLNGYKVRVTIEILDVPENRTDEEIIGKRKVILSEQEEKETHERFAKGEGVVCKEQYPYSAQGDYSPCEKCGHEGRWHTFRYGQSVCYACSKEKRPEG
jgi:hypothetical protein